MSDPQLTVLVSTMNRTDGCRDLIKEIGITGDAVIVNQCEITAAEVVPTSTGQVLVLSSENRGVGRSRNLAFAHAPSGIVLFADDDLQYHAAYQSMVLGAFETFPDADVMLFELESDDPGRGRPVGTDAGRVYLRGTKYGGPKIAVRTESVQRARISFSELFGGGAPYAAGEDTLFLRDCLTKGLKVYLSGRCIGRVNYGGSSWFRGFDAEYLHDRGALFRSMFGRFYFPFALAFALRHRAKFAVNIGAAMHLMMQGSQCVAGGHKCTRHEIGRR